MAVNEETQQKINQLQLLEQNLQNFLMQKQQFQSQLTEINSALEEVQKSEKSYKIVGNVMVASKKDALLKELEEKKSTINLRIKTIEKQEEKIREKAKTMQKDVMGAMEEKK